MSMEDQRQINWERSEPNHFYGVSIVVKRNCIIWEKIAYFRDMVTINQVGHF